MTEPRWTSRHIHYQEPLDRLINGAIRPLFADLTGGCLVEDHFFVRHWQAGPHLRLRLKPRTSQDAAKVADLVDRHVRGFLDTSPSRTVISEQEYLRIAQPLVVVERGQDTVEPLQPDNSMRTAHYEPELGRYGDTPEAMRAVERHFTESSELAADIVASDVPADRRSGQALTMMLVSAMVAANGAGGLTGYFDTGQRGWGRQLLFGDVAASEQLFEAKFQRQRPRLVRLVWRLVELVEAGATDEAGPEVARWTASTTALRQRLDGLQQQGLFAPRELLMGSTPDAGLRSVLLFCSHMHNNRLGISLPAESYLMYLLWRSISEITGGAN
ncbi:thiopeptide-type bacteriocin biosynthesis protein [Saccharopolyspora sp. ASAGF58]|uniref:thiopeptide-type bacteriocin biosynthesis protein n=1 Tax=Saccharopolyspora sp. ASAGF58 TaxID=2719023 RepID=UPI00143FDEF2|nr:thiopeptide-type bacteriocin biosynthesis protein [Saccharopolyspora sp. ASAGF58]QIZ37404.1 hypothetical protein FDZ84_25920 [Saccharopolyspora sp. ASAGF58]